MEVHTSELMLGQPNQQRKRFAELPSINPACDYNPEFRSDELFPGSIYSHSFRFCPMISLVHSVALPSTYVYLERKLQRKHWDFNHTLLHFHRAYL